VVTFAVLSPTGQKVNSSIVYKPGPHSFYIDCRDSYGNSHTIPGAIKSAVIVGAGPLDVEPTVHSLAAVTASRRLDSECQVSYVSQGRYRLVCTLLRAGCHPLVVTTGCAPGIPKQLVIASYMVSGDSNVWPQHCWLDPTNVYEGLPFSPCTCYIYLYDRYFNPYYYGREVVVCVHLGTYSHLVFLHATSVPNRYMFTFTPEVLSACNLKVSINGVFIGDLPKTFTAVLQRESLEERLACFREEVARSLQHSLFLVNPMIRVNRSEILESALVHRVALRQRLIAVSFEGESGIDAGGMSRYMYTVTSCNVRYCYTTRFIF
jgi:hypothetical protein